MASPSNQPKFPADEMLLRLVHEGAWGELAPSDRVVLAVTSRRLASDTTRAICLEVRVAEHYREWGGKTIRVEGKTLVLETFVDEQSLYMSRIADAISTVLENLLSNFATALAPDLYEADPRIGLVVEVRPPYVAPSPWESDPKPRAFPRLPLCPLFDTPGGVHLPEERPHDFALSEKHHLRWSCCRRCGTLFERYDRVSWGGGNLLWVCADCATPDAKSLATLSAKSF